MKNQSNNAIKAYIEVAKQSPRLNKMLNDFSDIVSGDSGVPNKPVTLNTTLLESDKYSLAFSEYRNQFAGQFNQHFVASLPYVMEEQCRFGAALQLYLQRHHTEPALKVYTLGDASGVMARALTASSQGRIQTLTCSPNKENEIEFHNNPVTNAWFYQGPFFDVNLKTIQQKGIDTFATGFDLIIEDTTFQMYSANRTEPIKLMKKNLKKDGIIVLIEKIKNSNIAEFAKREQQKDNDFKRQFFSQNSIDSKKQTIVNEMNEMLVSIEELSRSIEQNFTYAVITWNSGNFYTVIASDNRENLSAFTNCMLRPAILDKYQYLTLPKQILGPAIQNLNFRDAE